MVSKTLTPIAMVSCVLLSSVPWAQAEDDRSLRMAITWGHRSPRRIPFVVKLSGEQLQIAELKLEHGEASDQLRNDTARSSAGAGDIDGLSGTLRFNERVVQPITNAQQIWKYLLKEGEPGAAARLQADPAWRPDPRKLTVQLDETGTRGFSLTIDQLLAQKAFWLPELDLFVSAGEPPISFAEHQRILAMNRGKRVLDRVARDPEASYKEYTARWEDMGNVAYNNPHAIAPGHIVGLTWDSALYKFGVDRFAEARNDYSKLDVFHFRFGFPDVARAWRGQKLADGLPIITTSFEQDGIRYEIEQFAFPLHGPPPERRGDLAMVLLQKVVVHETAGKARLTSLEMQLTRESSRPSVLREQGGAFVLGGGTNSLLALQGATAALTAGAQDKKKLLTINLELPANETRQFIVKLPSPIIGDRDLEAFLKLDYAACRNATVKFWNDYLAQGAYFNVPDPAVNTLFRANLWHALRLPRRHGAVSGSDVKVDLPYSNFAYDQKGTPWPVNQAVYVDYMLYDLRGYHALAAEELDVIYRNNQEPNGHVGGFANWGVYTPSMLYSVAQHLLLSGDRDSKLLPRSLRALDWCLAEMRRAQESNNPTPGLIFAPLNDLTHDPRSWAFNQAYFAAGFQLLGRALAEMGHPRAAECRSAAEAMRAAVEREFGRASVRAPAVQLADGTWSVYVPTDAQGSGRMFQVWYPTDVDVGPLHLLRLNALDVRGPLATAILNDHEDNLFLNQWGTINEPVYNMQGTAYLLRDQPKAAIRTFYSTMACAFSHSVFEPVEHRWAWGQYFGPPSTDGAWFELYRHMLIREPDDNSLLLCQAAPRAWFENGKTIEVRRAPTYFGPLTFAMQSRANDGELSASIEWSPRKTPAALVVRFRHPESKPIRSVSVNGRKWGEFDLSKEWVRISNPKESRYTIRTHY